MKGDFSTIRYDRSKHFNRVLKQQGRVELDSDWNEQTAILQHLIRTVVRDLVGPSAGPQADCGFGLGDWESSGRKPKQHDFLINPGRYYVDGLLVENEALVPYSAQPHLPDAALLDTGKTYLAYLDVWERHVTVLEDDSLQETALGGPDTCTRVQTAWAVRTVLTDPPPSTDAIPPTAASERELKAAEAKLADIRAQLDSELTATQRAKLEKTAAQLEARIQELAAQIGDGQPRQPAPDVSDDPCERLLEPIRGWTSGTMAARLPDEAPADSPCVLPIASRYRGLENHLYRIEVHAGGDTGDADAVPTFKWSRENGSIATGFVSVKGADLKVANARGFSAGAWVEVSTETDELLGRPGLLRRVARVEGDVLTLDETVSLPKAAINPIVRRWDQTASEAQPLMDGALPIVAGAGEQGWIALEDGIEVQFGAGPYRTGDHWWITARVATGEIDWPRDTSGKPQAVQPHGVEHHYAPLYTLTATETAPFISLVEDCRCRFARLPCIADQA